MKEKLGIIVPAYFDAHSSNQKIKDWWANDLVNAATALKADNSELVVIANPYEGVGVFGPLISDSQLAPYIPAGEVYDGPNYSGVVGTGAVHNLWLTALHAVRQAGAKVIGYVHTHYLTDAAHFPNARAEVELWAKWYATVLDGIFFDAVSEYAAKIPSYQTLYSDVMNWKDDATVVLNPGEMPDAGYFDISWSSAAATGPVRKPIICAFESEPSNASTRFAELWLKIGCDSRDRVLILVKAASTKSEWEEMVRRTRASHFGWLYVTHDVDPNPWDELSNYFTDTVTEITTGFPTTAKWVLPCWLMRLFALPRSSYLWLKHRTWRGRLERYP